MAVAYDSWTVLPHGPIEKLAENLWRVEGSLPNMPLKRVLTVARMRDGRLVLHNGIALNDDAMEQIEAWGEPAFLVVPNGYHRLDAKVFKQRYPRITVVAPEGARKAVERVVAVDRTYDDFVGDDTVQLEHARGVKNAEGVMRVRSTDGVTLVFNDLIFNLEHGGGLYGLVFRALGSTGGPRVTRITRLLVIKDKAATRAWLRDLANATDVKRIVVSHGAPIMHDAAGVLREVAERL